MKKAAAVFTVVLVAGMLGVVASIPAASQTEPQRTEVNVYELAQGYSKVIDERREGLSRGDLIVENLPVFDSTTDAKVGETVTVVTIVRGPADNPLIWIDCEVAVTDGVLVFSGGARFAEFFTDGATFAVTGGTGAYRDATGSVVVTHEERDAGTTFNFDFDLRV